MIYYYINSDSIKNHIYIPKYYDPQLASDVLSLQDTHDLHRVGDLVTRKVMSISSGDEVGKAAYGTGDVPFVRTSDLSNWEIRSVPKQGVSSTVHEKYRTRQDVKEGDILLVKDGTYLIGQNCFITLLDREIVYQSHIYKLRVLLPEVLSPYLLFLALNSDIVQRQLRSVQFTADIIDTIGDRFYEVVIPIPKNAERRIDLIDRTKRALGVRVKGRAFVKFAPTLIESALLANSIEPVKEFLSLSIDEMAPLVTSDTISAEFGAFEATWLRPSLLRNSILLPKYYDPSIREELEKLRENCALPSMGYLQERGHLTYSTGVEIGKMAYGTGSIPFIRTSDFASWEIKHDPKQGVSESIYAEYRDKAEVFADDLFLVRDGTYLVGSSCIVTSVDKDCLFSGGIYRIRSNSAKKIDPHLLLGLMSSYVVKRQIRARQFTRDVIDTLGNRLSEIRIPIPKSTELRSQVSQVIGDVVSSRVDARVEIKNLATEIAKLN